MMNTVVVCDCCGAPKKEANHWWRIHFTPELAGGVVELRIMAAGDSHGTNPAFDADVCGQACVSKFVSRWLDHGNFEEQMK